MIKINNKMLLLIKINKNNRFFKIQINKYKENNKLNQLFNQLVIF